MLLKTFLQVYFKLCSFLDLRSTIFRFCVKFYPPDPALLQEEYTRYCVLFCNYYMATVPPESIYPLGHGKTSSLPKGSAANSPR